jgi:CDP-diglyceride synthetase
MSTTQLHLETTTTSNGPEPFPLRRGATIIGLLSIALIHVLDLPGKWAETRYLGIGYVLVIVASLVLAEIISTRVDKRAMYASAALSAAVLAGFIINRTVGMPHATEDIGNWGEPLGLASLFVEAITVWVTARGAYKMHRRQR